MSFKKERQVDDYTLVCVIGKGCLGKVFLVRDKSNDKIYAMKVVKKKHLQREGKVDQVFTERNLLVDLHNPFIIDIVCSFQNEKRLYILLQYCPGGDLFNLMALKQKFTQQQAKFYIAQVILVLEYLHSKDIVYRDLRPENILVSKDGYVKVTDFGLSKKSPKNQLQTFTMNGIPEYLSPQVLEHKKCTQTVDYWAVGLMLHEMTTGQMPFLSENINQFYENIKHQPFAMDGSFNLSAQLKSLLEGLLIKDPTKRLGVNGIDQIKKHPWFNGVNWNALVEKKYKAPFVPMLSSEEDTSYFNEEITKENLNSYDESYSRNSFLDPAAFENFTYDGQGREN